MSTATGICEPLSPADFAEAMDRFFKKPEEVHKIVNAAVRDVVERIVRGPLYCSKGSTKGCVAGCLGS